MNNKLEYNSTREKMVIPEYGRNIQKLVDICCAMEQREERTRAAKLIVKMMAQIQGYRQEPTLEQQHKLWDHLFIISDFRLDVEAPFENPKHIEKPQTLEKPMYNTAVNNSHRSYGNYIKSLAEAVTKIDDPEARLEQTLSLANHVKKCYVQWSQESVTDELIINQLRIISGGKLDLPDDTVLLPTSDVLELYQMENMQDQKGGAARKNSTERKRKKKKK